MYISLQTKISLTIVSIVLLFTFFTLFYFPSQRHKLLLNSYHKEVQTLSNTVALGVQIALDEQNYEGVQTAMEFVKGNPDLRFVSLLELDTVWNDRHSAYQIEETVFKSFPEGFVPQSGATSNDSIILVRSPFETSLMSGAVMLGFSTNTIHESVSKAFRTSLLISSVIFFIGLLIGLFVSRHFSAPVIALLNASRRVAKGDLSPVVSNFSNDEIGDLAKGFNVMVKELENSRNELYQANRALSDANANLSAALQDLKTTQVQLIQSEKMASLGELTAGIAHEIQNPLNFVTNFSEINAELLNELQEMFGSEVSEKVLACTKEIKENEQKILHHGKRADAIVKNMLLHSGATSGNKEPTDINSLVGEYIRISYHGLRAKDKSFNANFITDFDESIGKIEVAPQGIGKVLVNLFNNAFYSVNEKKKQLDGTYKPTVVVSTRKEGSRVKISVKDNGTGISRNVLDKIYQPFFTTKPTGQGTGLGLSLSYDVITKGHNGTLTVHSTEGEGAEFVVELPVC